MLAGDGARVLKTLLHWEGQMKALAYIGNRLTEASSYAGLAAVLLGAAHVNNATGVAQAIVGVLVSLGGLIAVLTRETPT